MCVLLRTGYDTQSEGRFLGARSYVHFEWTWNQQMTSYEESDVDSLEAVPHLRNEYACPSPHQPFRRHLQPPFWIEIDL